MKQNNRLLSRYYREIKSGLPCTGKEQKKIILGIKANVEDYLYRNPEASMADVEQHFGTPASIVSSYIDNADCEKIISKLHIRKTTKKVVIAVAAIIVLLWGTVVGWAAIKEWQHINGWQTTDIVEEID